jgi:hypothetical protein
VTFSGTKRAAPAPPVTNRTEPSDQRVLVIVLAVWVFLVWYADFRYQALIPLPIDAPAHQFSASRAEPILQMVAGDSLPRNAGSPQNEIVRKRIIDFLTSHGYEVQVQTGEGTVNPKVRERSPDQDVVPLANIVTRLKGRDSTSAIMLAAHYDSVPFGPGACDNGVGSAVVLEIASMLAAEPPPPRDVIFLLSDGEELGMLGAGLFIDDHPWAEEVEVAINLEARGTSGPSCMFETSNESRWLVPLFARVSPKPISSSLFFEIYKRLPNDTDFSVFSDAGMQGYNFAFVGEVENYHTSDDNLENASRGSLQHHGENALSLMRELLRVQIPRQPTGRAVYFDLYAWKLFWWPETWSPGLSCLAILLFAGVLFLDRRRQPSEQPPTYGIMWYRVASGFGLVLLAVLLVFLLGWVLVKLCSFDPRLQNLWPEQPIPYAAAFWLAAFALLCFLSMTLFGRRSLRNVTISTIAFWFVLGLMSSFGAAGASHLFIVPAVSIATAGIFLAWSSALWKWLALLFPVAVGVMWLSLERIFYDGVGFQMLDLMMIRVAVVTSSLLPAMKCASQDWLYKWSLAGTTAAAFAFALAIALNPAA